MTSEKQEDKNNSASAGMAASWRPTGTLQRAVRQCGAPRGVLRKEQAGTGVSAAHPGFHSRTDVGGLRQSWGCAGAMLSHAFAAAASDMYRRG